jgi:hypothetical protein
MKYFSDLILLVSFILFNLKYFDFCLSKAQVIYLKQIFQLKL